MTDKKLDLIDVKNIVDQADADGIRIHPETWDRLTRIVPTEPSGGSGSSAGRITFSRRNYREDFKMTYYAFAKQQASINH